MNPPARPAWAPGPWSPVLLGGLAGLVHAASFAPLNLWWLQPIALAALLLCGIGNGAAGKRRAALCGLGFGFAWFVTGVAWLFVSMHRYGGMPAPMAAAALLLFSLYLGAFPAASLALSAGALRRAFVSPSARAIAGAALLFPGCWGAGEMLRGWLFTGFPWLSSGYAHTDGPLAGLAPIVGVHGVGMMAALAAFGLAFAAARLRAGPLSGLRGVPIGGFRGGPVPARGFPRSLAAVAIAVGLPIALGMLAAPIRWVAETGEPIRVRLVQGNVPQQMKFDPATAVAAMRAYAAAIAAQPADLVVLPETAWTVPWARTPAAIAEAITAALRAGGGIAAIGMPLPAETRDGARTIANSVAAIGGEGPLDWRYDKRHLVPFGEFVPFAFGWFVRMMEIPLGDFGRGPTHQPALEVRGQRLAFDICYEDIFGDELAPQVRDGATILVNVSNIAWFGDSHALPQHLQIARMRALELARPILRATNTGMTAAIDSRGRVVAALAPYTTDSLAVELRGTTGLTPYARAGDFAPLALLVLMAAAGRALQPRRPSEATVSSNPAR